MSFFSIVDKNLEVVETGNVTIWCRIRFLNLNNNYFEDLANSVDEQLLVASKANKSQEDIVPALTLELMNREKVFFGKKQVKSQMKTIN